MGDGESFDVVVVGAGPGGIAAAVTAAEAGHTVALIDDAPFAGGQIWRNRGEPAKSRKTRDWFSRVESSRITRLRQSRVVAAVGKNRLLVETADGPKRVDWTSLILATGSRELFLPFPGWTTPNVVGVGAMQALVKQGLPVSGKRITVAGTGPLLLAVADLLRARGAVVPLILEQAPAGRINRFAVSLIRSPSKLLAGLALRARLLGTRYRPDSFPLSVQAAGAGLRVDCRTGGRNESIDCDYLACGFNLIPNNELPQVLGCELAGDGFVRVDGRLRTTVPGIYAVGEVTGVGGADKAALEGQIAGHAAAGNEPAASHAARQRAAALDFTARLAATFRLRPELLKLANPDTIVCRCEDVPLSAVVESVSARHTKLQTRCGMGSCQGRICGPILQRLAGTEPQQIRPPVFATTIGTLAGAVE